ncbi:hypothetical protein EV363DRAFT_1178608 [Boletus edulis]|nr:hypothetical protein EV363DRAFT_1178608 [Boletus edulis]
MVRKSSTHLLVTMSAHMKPGEIYRVTGISARTVRGIMELWRMMGAVQQSLYFTWWPEDHSRHNQFLKGCIERTPDLYLSELKQELEPEEACRISVSDATIARHCVKGFFLENK